MPKKAKEEQDFRDLYVYGEDNADDTQEKIPEKPKRLWYSGVDKDGKTSWIAAKCDYIVMVSVTYPLGGGEPMCEFIIYYGGEFITRSYPAKDFLHRETGGYRLIKNLAELGFFLSDITESELIAYIRRQYKKLRKNPYYITAFRGWVKHNGQLLFVSDKIYGGNYRSSPKLHPAYQLSANGNLGELLKIISKECVDWRPAEMALGLPLGSTLLFLLRKKITNFAAGTVGFIAPPALSKTTLLNFSSSIYCDPFYENKKSFDTASYDDVSLPAVLTANNTVNCLFGSLDKINGIFMQIDDFTGGVISDVQPVLYQIIIGTEKGKMDGALDKPRKPRKFSFYVGLSSETSLILPETKLGIMRRYYELRLSNFCRDATHSENLQKTTQHHGHLGRAWIEKLIPLLETNAAEVDSIIEDCERRLNIALDKLEIKDEENLRSHRQLLRLFSCVPASLVLFNRFFCTGKLAICKPIDIDGFIDWMALMASFNTKEHALGQVKQVSLEWVVDFIKNNFYGTYLENSVVKFGKLSSDKDFTSRNLDICDSAKKRVGFKKGDIIAIKGKEFRFAYEEYKRSYNLNVAKSTGTPIKDTARQFLGKLKALNLLSCDAEHYSRKVVFSHFAGGHPKSSPRCYVFKLTPNAVEPEYEGDTMESILDATPIPDKPKIEFVEELLENGDFISYTKILANEEDDLL